eukprot:TRINITY_DN7692_c0_g1_i3.p1 TRINITY_DN7692_c0_g1~~TRINITY_DN7692_c0_g1_i3.p1  ORF type:complete len:333 (+),score=61.97 TRINITY_DN7692_c0_g1_i3:83-1081(+)
MCIRDRIRALKASGAPEEEWRALVADLNLLKDQLPADHPHSQARFAAAKQQELASKKAQEVAARKQMAERLAVQAALLVFPVTQRKVLHAIQTCGFGDDFKYAGPTLNLEVPGMVDGAEVWVTEKWDGTTVQATRHGVFKRLDKFTRGSKAKRSVPVADRYELRLVGWCESPGVWVGLESDERIAECIRPYLEVIERIPEDMCIFFEAVHTKINQTFKHIDNFAEIRVFDVAACSVPCSEVKPGEQWPAESKFLEFSQTIQLCEQLGLPVVAHKRAAISGEQAWSWLTQSKEYTDVPALLEGFVLRGVGSELVAKLRVEYLSTRNEKKAMGN